MRFSPVSQNEWHARCKECGSTVYIYPGFDHPELASCPQCSLVRGHLTRKDFEIVLHPEVFHCVVVFADLAGELIAVVQKARERLYVPVFWKLTHPLSTALIQSVGRSASHPLSLTKFYGIPVDETSGVPHLLCDDAKRNVGARYELEVDGRG